MAIGDTDGAQTDPENVIRLARPGARSQKIEPPLAHVASASSPPSTALVNFDRAELQMILGLYGRQVAAGEWRDYAIDFAGDRATFSVMRGANEYPVYRIQKVPALARKQGAFSVVSVTGYILKRGHDLRKVLAVLEPKPKLRQA